MQKPQIALHFIELLRKSELLDDEEIIAAVEKYSLQNRNAIQTARILIKKGHLTRFQAERLLDGRYRGFFIDQYKLQEVLGIGGMGTVYIATNRETDEKVALKVLTESHELDAGMLTRLKLEAKAGMMLNHPNIVKTKRIEHKGAKCFVEMELVEGINLHELIALTGPVAWPQACDFIMQAALGLHHSHQKGLIHRDVKPANFLVDKNGNLKVLDFGLAYLKDSKDEEFSLAMIFGHDCLGTADFIAPEQIDDSLNVDARSDIYSLGCMFYSTVTAKVPFPYSTNAKKLEAQKTEQPISIREYIPQFPVEIEAILLKMIEKNPADRFQSAGEVAKVLEKYAKRKRILFEMHQILSIRAQQARKRKKQIKPKKSSQVASSSAWTSSSAKLSGTIGQTNIETAVGKDTTPLQKEGANSGADPALIFANYSWEEMKQTHFGKSKRSDEDEKRPSVWKLRCLDTGEEFEIENTCFVVGSDHDCDVTIKNPHVSSYHCEIAFENNVWRISDLGSKNGIQVDGKDVQNSFLETGKEFSISKKLTFQIVPVEDIEELTARSSSGTLKRTLLIVAGVAILTGIVLLSIFLS